MEGHEQQTFFSYSTMFAKAKSAIAEGSSPPLTLRHLVWALSRNGAGGGSPHLAGLSRVECPVWSLWSLTRYWRDGWKSAITETVVSYGSQRHIV